MDKPITIIGAPTNIGIKPYENGEPRGLDQAPAVFRQLGLPALIGADDAGDVMPRAYRDFTRTPGRTRNEDDVAEYCRQLAHAVDAVVSRGCFALVLGGDCSIVLGSLLGARRAVGAPVALAYVDGHADFATPEESLTGSAASMCLGLAVGRGDTPLARLGGSQPLVEPHDVALVGRRDHAEPWYGHEALQASAVLDIPAAELSEAGSEATAAAVLARLSRSDVHGYWVHLDADVIDPGVMPAVDSPEPDGPSIAAVAELLTPIVRHPKALGLECTIYDPKLDADLACGRRMLELLGNVLAG